MPTLTGPEPTAPADPCAHQLQLLPIVEFTLTYRCRRCEERIHQAITPANAGRSIEAISREVAAGAGGTYTGEFDWKLRWQVAARHALASADPAGTVWMAR